MNRTYRGPLIDHLLGQCFPLRRVISQPRYRLGTWDTYVCFAIVPGQVG